MKLSAPPPPPPEPPQPGDPPGGAAPGPDAALPPLPEPPPPPPPARPATWPQWFAGADTTLALLAVGLAFLAASFAARNSDVWLHLAAGRMLTTGEYRPGSDPFSYTAADRPWVNHAWLFDLGAYALYRGDGFALVLLKALAVAAAVGLLVGIRRPGHALWPWAAVAVVAVLAAAPRLTLNPLVGSFLFLAVTLFLVFRLPSPPGSWRLPAAVGVTFWLWANTDAWFFTGPLALALLLVGELIRTKGLNADGPATPADDPLGPLPDAATLAKALGVGVLACMLNPHHVRVWELPFELTGGAGADDNSRLAQLFFSPLTAAYWDNAGLGYNFNGLAFAALLLGGVYAVALTAVVGRLAGRPWDVEPLPLPHAVLWCGFAALALRTYFAVPLLAAVSVPLLASRLNAFSAAVVLGPAGDSRTRLVLALSTVGRAASLLGLVALGVCAWPGWLHPPTPNPAFARRVGWEVLPDPALARAAGRFGEWRAAGLLGPDDRGFVASLDLANYLAWHAPAEKVFANARYAFHRAEWPAFTKARFGLGTIRAAEPADLRDAAAVFDANGLTYATVSAAAGDSAQGRALARDAALQMWGNPDRWAAWYLDGRTAVCGWKPGPGAPPPTFDRLRVDPVALAFGPAAERLRPPGPPDPPPPPRLWLDDFTRPARLASAGADEALAWLDYRDRVSGRYAVTYQVSALLLRAVPAPASPPLAANLFQFAAEGSARSGNRPYLTPADGSFTAIPILALKAARRAVADNPDHPDGYAAVARALADPGLPINDSERAVGIAVALRQALSRFPEPEDFARGVFTASPTQTAQELAALYAGNPQQTRGIPGFQVDLPGVRELVGMELRAQGGQQVQVPFHHPADLAQEAMALALKYAEKEIGPSPGETREQRDTREQLFRGLKQQSDRLQAARQPATEQYRREAERNPKAKARFDAAVKLNLTGEAIRLFKQTPGPDLEAAFGPDLPDVILKVVALELAVGRVEDAAADADQLKLVYERVAAQPQPPGLPVQRALLRAVELQILVLTGSYEAAGRELEATEGRVVAAAPPPPPADLLPFGWPLASALPAAPPTLDLGLYFRHRVSLYAQTRQQVLSRTDAEATFFFRRGYFSLLEGDIDAAKTRFQQSRRPAVPAWDIPELGFPAGPLYVRLIEAAAKR